MIVLKATQEKLLAVLQSVAGIVEKRHPLPLLANVLLRKGGSDIQVRAEVEALVVLHAVAIRPVRDVREAVGAVTGYEQRAMAPGRRRRRTGASCWRLVGDSSTRRHHLAS